VANVDASADVYVDGEKIVKEERESVRESPKVVGLIRKTNVHDE